MLKVQAQDILRGLLITALCGSLMTGCKNSTSNPAGPGGGGTGGTITVTGKVIGQNSQPQSGVPVIILGTTIPSVNTDANGNFTISNVTTPYNIAVVDGADKASLVYKGLTRSDPTLVWPDIALGTARTATLSGTIYPASAFPEPATRRARIVFGSPEVAVGAIVNSNTGNYSINATWYGPTTTTGTVYTLQWSFDAMTALPTSYDGFGARSGISLLDATANPNGNDTLSVVSSSTISGTVTPAAGYTLAAKSLSVAFANNASIPLATDNTAAGSFSFLTPSLNGATIMIAGSATKSGNSSSAHKVGLSASATGVALSVPAAPELSLPIDATTGVTKSSQFSWSPVPNAVHLLVFQGAAGLPRYLVLTTAASDSIPDMTTAGLGLPASTNYQWSVLALGPFSNLDAAAASSGFLSGVTMPVAADGFFGRSVTRTFTTAP